MSATQITDEMLTAYLDSELDAHETSKVEAALAKNAALSQRLQSLDIVTQDLKPAFDLFLKDAPTAPSFELPKKQPWSWSFFPAMTAVAASVAAAAFFVTVYPFDRTAGLSFHERVAVYQELYVYETVASLSFTESEKSGQLDVLTGRLGYDMTSFGQIEGLNFLRGQLLGLDGEDLAHLSYLSDNGRPIALCAVRMADADEAGANVTEMLGLTAITWNDAGYAFILIGELEDELIESFVTSLG